MLSDPAQKSRSKSQFPVNDPLLENDNWWRDGGPRAFALGISLLVNFLVFQQLQHVDISFAEVSSRNWEREIEYAFEEPTEPEESRYVETNPDVPTNIPDETDNFASRDQQSAQEEPTPLVRIICLFWTARRRIRPKSWMVKCHPTPSRFSPLRG